MNDALSEVLSKEVLEKMKKLLTECEHLYKLNSAKQEVMIFRSFLDSKEYQINFSKKSFSMLLNESSLITFDNADLKKLENFIRLTESRYQKEMVEFGVKDKKYEYNFHKVL